MADKKIQNQGDSRPKAHHEIDASRGVRETVKPLNHRTIVHKPTAAELKLTKLNAPKNTGDYVRG
jgi:hypothetical protein